MHWHRTYVIVSEGNADLADMHAQFCKHRHDWKPSQLLSVCFTQPINCPDTMQLGFISSSQTVSTVLSWSIAGKKQGLRERLPRNTGVLLFQIYLLESHTALESWQLVLTGHQASRWSCDVWSCQLWEPCVLPQPMPHSTSSRPAVSWMPWQTFGVCEVARMSYAFDVLPAYILCGSIALTYSSPVCYNEELC